MGVDMIWIGDDIGTQNTMLMSPETWRRFLKPRMARFISTIKAINPALKVAYHSDGCIYRVIPELIEIGVDVLNPVQPRSMDPALLKEKYGRRLCFWGIHRRAAHPSVRRARGRQGGGGFPASDRGQGRRSHHRSDPPRAARHSRGEYPGPRGCRDSALIRP